MGDSNNVVSISQVVGGAVNDYRLKKSAGWLRSNDLKPHQQDIVAFDKPSLQDDSNEAKQELEADQVKSLDHIRKILDFLFELKMKKLKNEQDFFESRRRGKLESLIINPVIDCMQNVATGLSDEKTKNEMLAGLNRAKTFFNADKNFKKETYFRNGKDAQGSTRISHEAFKARCQSEFKATVYQDKPAEKKQKLLEILRQCQKMTSVSMFWRFFGYSRTAVQKLVIESLSNHLQQDVAIEDATFRAIDGNWSSGDVVEKEKKLKSLLVVLPCGASSGVTPTDSLKRKLKAHLDDFIKRTRGWGILRRTEYQQRVISSFEDILASPYDTPCALAQAVEGALNTLKENKPRKFKLELVSQGNHGGETDHYIAADDGPKNTPLFDAFSADITSLITPSLQASISSRNDGEGLLTEQEAILQA